MWTERNNNNKVESEREHTHRRMRRKKKNGVIHESGGNEMKMNKTGHKRTTLSSDGDGGCDKGRWQMWRVHRSLGQCISGKEVNGWIEDILERFPFIFLCRQRRRWRRLHHRISMKWGNEKTKFSSTDAKPDVAAEQKRIKMIPFFHHAFQALFSTNDQHQANSTLPKWISPNYILFNFDDDIYFSLCPTCRSRLYFDLVHFRTYVWLNSCPTKCFDFNCLFIFIEISILWRWQWQWRAHINHVKISKRKFDVYLEMSCERKNPIKSKLNCQLLRNEWNETIGENSDINHALSHIQNAWQTEIAVKFYLRSDMKIRQ